MFSPPYRRYGLIYVLTNQETGDQYVGQTTRSKRYRFGKHWIAAKAGRRDCPRLYNALRKYGRNAFLVEILDWAMTKDELDQKERFWIAFLDTIDEGYNLMSGGYRGRPSDEVKAKIGKAHKGRISPLRGKARSLTAVEQGVVTRRKRKLAPQATRLSPERCVPILCVETQRVFASRAAAAAFIAKTVPNIRQKNVSPNLVRACKTGGSAYGFH